MFRERLQCTPKVCDEPKSLQVHLAGCQLMLAYFLGPIEDFPVSLLLLSSKREAFFEEISGKVKFNLVLCEKF